MHDDFGAALDRYGSSGNMGSEKTYNEQPGRLLAPSKSAPMSE